MKLEASQDALRFLRSERLTQAVGPVRVQLITNQRDLLGIRKMGISQVTQTIGEINFRATRCYLHTPPAFQRSEDHEQVRCSLPP